MRMCISWLCPFNHPKGLARLVECWSAEQDVVGLIPRPNQYSGFFNSWSYLLFPIKYLDRTFSWLGGPCSTGSLMSSRRHKKVACHDNSDLRPPKNSNPGMSRKLGLSITVDTSLIPFSTRWSSQFESWRWKKLADYSFVVRNASDARRAKVCDNTLSSSGHNFLQCEKYFFRKPASINKENIVVTYQVAHTL